MFLLDLCQIPPPSVKALNLELPTIAQGFHWPRNGPFTKVNGGDRPLVPAMAAGAVALASQWLAAAP